MEMKDITQWNDCPKCNEKGSLVIDPEDGILKCLYCDWSNKLLNQGCDKE